jgi:phytoene synthase
VPRDLLASVGTTPEEFVSADAGPAAIRAIDAMVALAREHLQAFRDGASALPASLRPAFLPAALVPAYLAAIARKGSKALTEPAEVAGWKRQWAMFRAASRGL